MIKKKNPTNKAKEEIGSLPGKEFRIMIIKMIQNLENIMELQINRQETRIQIRSVVQSCPTLCDPMNPSSR